MSQQRLCTTVCDADDGGDGYSDGDGYGDGGDDNDNSDDDMLIFRL